MMILRRLNNSSSRSLLHGSNESDHRCLTILLSFLLLVLPLEVHMWPTAHLFKGSRAGYSRNIRPLQCTSRTGETGLCMFAWDCMKSNGTHLDTCIDRFYFGSCCNLKGSVDPPVEGSLGQETSNHIDSGDSLPVTSPQIVLEISNILSNNITHGNSGHLYPPTNAHAVASTLSSFASTTSTSVLSNSISSGLDADKPNSTFAHQPSVAPNVIETNEISLTENDSSQQSDILQSDMTLVETIVDSIIGHHDAPETTTPGTSTENESIDVDSIDNHTTAVEEIDYTVTELIETNSENSISVTDLVNVNYNSSDIEMNQIRNDTLVDSADALVDDDSETFTEDALTSDDGGLESTQHPEETIATDSKATVTTTESASMMEENVVDEVVTEGIDLENNEEFDESNVHSSAETTTVIGSLQTEFVLQELTPAVTETINNGNRDTTPEGVLEDFDLPTSDESTQGIEGTKVTLPFGLPKLTTEVNGELDDMTTTKAPISTTIKTQVEEIELIPVASTAGSRSTTEQPTVHVQSSTGSSTSTNLSSSNDETTTTSKQEGIPTVESEIKEPSERPLINETGSTTGTPITPQIITSSTTAAPQSSSSSPESTTLSQEQQEQKLVEELKTANYKDVCGNPVYPVGRIVGGYEATYGEWPWQVSLRQWRSVAFLHKCGAAIVNENWAITAAHCVEGIEPDQLMLVMGEFDLGTTKEPYGHVERTVQVIAMHPKFEPRTFEYDLALLRFSEPVEFQPNIIPICIPDDDYEFLNETGYVTGWGRLYEDGPLPTVMQKVPVPIIPNKNCEGMYERAGYIEHIPHIFICAGYQLGRQDSCEGDSGGPMVINYKNRWRLAGIISWGIGCAVPNQPGVYTRISEFKEWINKIIIF